MPSNYRKCHDSCVSYGGSNPVLNGCPANGTIMFRVLSSRMEEALRRIREEFYEHFWIVKQISGSKIIVYKRFCESCEDCGMEMDRMENPNNYD